jgi:hypothetical protein
MAASEAKQYAQRNQQGSDWFTHDKSESAAATVTNPPAPVAPVTVVEAAVPSSDGSTGQRAHMIKPKCDSNQWYKYDGPGDVEKPVQATEGGTYCRRDKAGSASEWFTHDHPDGSTGDDVQQSALLKEGTANAARMRSESAAWFTYDKEAGEQSAGVMSLRGRGAGNRPGSSEMHGIFHHAGAHAGADN